MFSFSGLFLGLFKSVFNVVGVLWCIEIATLYAIIKGIIGLF